MSKIKSFLFESIQESYEYPYEALKQPYKRSNSSTGTLPLPELKKRLKTRFDAFKTKRAQTHVG